MRKSKLNRRKSNKNLKMRKRTRKIKNKTTKRKSKRNKQKGSGPFKNTAKLPGLGYSNPGFDTNKMTLHVLPAVRPLTYINTYITDGEKTYNFKKQNQKLAFFDQQNKNVCNLQIFECNDEIMIIPAFIGKNNKSGCKDVTDDDYSFMTKALHNMATEQDWTKQELKEGEHSENIKFKEYYVVGNQGLEFLKTMKTNTDYVGQDTADKADKAEVVYAKVGDIKNISDRKNPDYRELPAGQQYITVEPGQQRQQPQANTYMEIKPGETGYNDPVKLFSRPGGEDSYMDVSPNERYNTRTTENEN